MQKKMILIVGKSGTGKDYLAKAFNLKMVVSHTTRPMRPDDVNGVTKWFHDPEEIDFDNVGIDIGRIVAYTEFDGHKYWATEFDLLGADAYIIDVDGVDYMVRIYGKYFDDMFSVIYISCAWYKRLYRLICRSGIRRGVKRFVHDIGKFKNIKNYDHTEIRA